MSRGLRKDRWRFAEGHSAVLDEAQELEIRITAIEKMKMTSENDILDTNHRLAPRHFSEGHISYRLTKPNTAIRAALCGTTCDREVEGLIPTGFRAFFFFIL